MFAQLSFNAALLFAFLAMTCMGRYHHANELARMGELQARHDLLAVLPTLADALASELTNSGIFELQLSPPIIGAASEASYNLCIVTLGAGDSDCGDLLSEVDGGHLAMQVMMIVERMRQAFSNMVHALRHEAGQPPLDAQVATARPPTAAAATTTITADDPKAAILATVRGTRALLDQVERNLTRIESILVEFVPKRLGQVKFVPGVGTAGHKQELIGAWDKLGVALEGLGGEVRRVHGSIAAAREHLFARVFAFAFEDRVPADLRAEIELVWSEFGPSQAAAQGRGRQQAQQVVQEDQAIGGERDSGRQEMTRGGRSDL